MSRSTSLKRVYDPFCSLREDQEVPQIDNFWIDYRKICEMAATEHKTTLPSWTSDWNDLQRMTLRPQSNMESTFPILLYWSNCCFHRPRTGFLWFREVFRGPNFLLFFGPAKKSTKNHKKQNPARPQGCRGPPSGLVACTPAPDSPRQLDIYIYMIYIYIYIYICVCK